MKRNSLAQKSIVICALLACSVLHLYADERSDFEQLLVDNTGYYYCYETDRLIWMTYGDPTDYDMKSTPGYSYLINISCDIDFTTGTITFGRGRGYEGIGSDSYNLKKAKSKFVIEGDTIISWTSSGHTYKALHMTAEEAAAYIINRSYTTFDKALGTWNDEKTGRSYTVTKGNSYVITAVYPAAEHKAPVTMPLQIESPYLLYVSTQEGSYSLNFGNDGGFTLYDSTEDPNKAPPVRHSDPYEDRCGDDDIGGYWVTFSFADYTPPAPAAPVAEKAPQRRIPLSGWYYYTYNGVLRYFTADMDRLLIWEYSTDTRRNECIDWITDFESYVDENGWKHVETKDYSFIVVEHDTNPLAFCYTGSSVKADAAAMASFATDASKIRDSYSGSKQIQVTNITASSSLREGTVTYAPETVFSAFNASRHLWLRDTKPWVEGVSGDGIGEKLEIDFVAKPGRYDEGITLEILGGYVDPVRPHLFKQNGRPKELEITTDTGFRETISLPDEPKVVTVDLPLETSHLTITIKDVYKGSKYSDTCITAVEARYWSGK